MKVLPKASPSKSKKKVKAWQIWIGIVTKQTRSETLDSKQKPTQRITLSVLPPLSRRPSVRGWPLQMSSGLETTSISPRCKRKASTMTITIGLPPRYVPALARNLPWHDYACFLISTSLLIFDNIPGRPIFPWRNPKEKAKRSRNCTTKLWIIQLTCR